MKVAVEAANFQPLLVDHVVVSSYLRVDWLLPNPNTRPMPPPTGTIHC